MSNSFPSARADIITRRTYCRPTEQGNFETWDQVVDRVISHQRWLWERARGEEPLGEAEKAELRDLAELIRSRKASVSGRTLWLGGTDISKTRESSQFNCAFTKVETIHDVVDVFWLLLQGCGVGFEPVTGSLNGFTKPAEIEVIRSERHNLVQQKGIEHNQEVWEGTVWRLIVGDSAMAWAKAVGKIVAQKRPFSKIVIDFRQIRPAGYRLAGYGWISSGDETLSRALPAICQIMNRRAGELLSRIDILDICNWLGTTLSSRRSAQIAVVPYGDPEWRDFASAKKDHFEANPQRSQSNNSLVFHQHPGKAVLYELFALMADAGGSEPGFLNAAAAKLRAPWFSGANPCLTGDTLLPTSSGLIRIASLAGQTVHLRDGKGKLVSAKIEKTASNAELLQVELSDGSIYRVTPSHEFVTVGKKKIQAQEMTKGLQLLPADISGMFGQIHDPAKAYKYAWLIADGTYQVKHQSSKLSLYEPKYDHREELESVGFSFTGVSTPGRVTAILHDQPLPYKFKVPDFVLAGDEETVKAFIRGYMQADGHINYSSKGYVAQIVCIHRRFLQEFQALLYLFGIKSKISKIRDAEWRDMPDGNGGEKLYFCKEQFRLSITGATKLANLVGFAKTVRGPYLTKTILTVESVIKLAEKEDVYCAGVPTTASFDLSNVHSGNCAEILLPNKGFCNLVEINLARFNGSMDRLGRAAWLLARANYRQTCVNLVDGVLQRAWHENQEFLRLTGVGVTGVVKWDRKDEPEAWHSLRGYASWGAESMAAELGTPKSKATTTVKPSGTLSKIMDTTEGAHKPLGRYIFNNVRFSLHDPYLALLRAAGYNIFSDPYNADSVLVTFPVDNGEGDWDLVDGREVNLESAVEQLERYKTLMDHYVDHNCSVTISYDPEEVPAIVDWLDRNWDSYVGVSFLYRTDPTKTAADLGYPYLPQEVVTREIFEAYSAKLLPLPGSRQVAEGHALLDLEVDAGEECAGGVCPVR